MKPNISPTITAIYAATATLSQIKWIALICMFIDHFAIAAPNPTIHVIMRGIGRIAFITFGFLIAYNYANKPQSEYQQTFWHQYNQIKWLSIFCLLSQIPYMVVSFSFQFKQKIHIDYFRDIQWLSHPINIFGVLLISAIWIIAYQHITKQKNNKNFYHYILFTLYSAICLVISHWIDYGVYGFLYIITTFFYLNNNTQLKHYLILLPISTAIMMNYPLFFGYKELIGNNAYYIIPFGLLWLIWILLTSNQIKKIKPKYHFINKLLFYSFYPLHLTLLTIMIELSK